MTEDINRYIKLYHDIYPYLTYMEIVHRAAFASGWTYDDYCDDAALLKGLRFLLERATA